VFENADIGLVMDGTSFNTVQNVTFTSTRPVNATAPYAGGKGIWLKVLCVCAFLRGGAFVGRCAWRFPSLALVSVTLDPSPPPPPQKPP
jgi:hypothetical protein